MGNKKEKVFVDIAPFSEKYIEYYLKCFVNRVNCLEGAYRAGKTVINVLSFANHVDFCEDKVHLVTGYSVATAGLNVVDTGGASIDLVSLFKGRCKQGKFKNNECLYIKDHYGRRKIIVIVGGGKSDSVKSIQGITFGSWLSVELANLFISDDNRDFIAMALSRLTSAKNQKIWWDLNPTYPSHRVYTKYLDVYMKQQNLGVFAGGYNYERCSLFDNKSLNEEQINNALAMYPDKTSIDYKRNILGERSAAEGIIFTQFAANPDEYIVEVFSEYRKYIKPQFISIGIDFGGNGSNTAFCATLISDNFSRVMPFYSDEIDMSKPENQNVKVYSEELKKFLQKVHRWRESVGATIRCIYCDCADTVMVNETRRVIRELAKYGLGGIRVENCYKATIKKRIDTKSMLLHKGKYHIFKLATHVIDSTSTQVWDKRPGHEDERLDDHTSDIDIADAEEYSWSSFINKLIDRNAR